VGVITSYMNKRPVSVTIISWLFIATGIIGLAYHFTELKIQGPFQYEAVWVLLLRLMAIVCGVYMLRGSNWARWLTMLWMAYHVVLSWFHSVQELVIHSLLFAVFAYFLFRAGAMVYFRRAERVD
jgi:hypothetical protein